MIPRQIFAVLTTVLVVLTVTVAAVMSCQALLSVLGDETGARFLRGIGLGCVLALLVDMVLLAGALGLKAMQSSDDTTQDG